MKMFAGNDFWYLDNQLDFLMAFDGLQLVLHILLEFDILIKVLKFQPVFECFCFPLNLEQQMIWVFSLFLLN
jgi:hypothetical protein